jgi:hypothetical protein
MIIAMSLKKIITRSPNTFGVLNSLGYSDFRLRFGYKVSINPSADLLDDVPVNNERFVLFYGLQDGKLSPYRLQPKDKNLVNFNRIIPKKFTISYLSACL